MNNLDFLCAKSAAEITVDATKDTEGVIGKALGVLQENGVYALFVFLLSRAKKEKEAEAINKGLAKLLHEQHLINVEEIEPNNIHTADGIGGLAQSLDNLLLAKDLLGLTLTYARYHAQARS